MTFDRGQSVGERLALWRTFQSAGKKPRTVQYQREIVSKIVEHWPALNARADAVTSKQVAEFIPLVAHLSAPRFNAIVAVLKAILPAAKDLKRRKVSPKHVTLPDQSEFTAMLAQIDQAPRSQGGLVIRFLALTGLRINEARQIEWRDVGESGIVVRPEISKNGRSRFIPFIGEIKSVLERLRSVSTGERVLPQLEAKRSLATACEMVGIRRLTHHDLRRLFATRCIESGVDIPTVARWMGHSDGGALLGRTYFHLADKHSQRMAGQVAIAV